MTDEKKRVADVVVSALEKDTSLIQNAHGNLVPVCMVHTLAVSRLFRVQG